MEIQRGCICCALISILVSFCRIFLYMSHLKGILLRLKSLMCKPRRVHEEIFQFGTKQKELKFSF